MAETVKINIAEANRVNEAVERYTYGFPSPRPFSKVAAEDLVNRIGEIYETALARGTR